ncbi:AraC family transcriptional regulator [Lacibacter sediminis]|uniref:Helix-turn-helix transcriptional regulator n=1 Tax=Lacibacter sediminis TaxID=2760713 RepID=A0A7G5XDY0_9BACT|nr:AraC family transcriptional regulator [Lacibacter sediminis]QNA43683.1 helix-turn-helix transcriptional regulator [Lacibacter sediminis]
MKIVQFTIPVAGDSSIVVQHEVLPHFYVHLHRHQEIQITYIKEGTGTLIAGNYMQPFMPGDIYILGANQPHLFKSDPIYFDKRKKKKVEALSLFFKPAQLYETVLALPETKPTRRFIEQTNSGLKIASASTKKIFDEMQQVQQAKQAYRLSSFIQLLQTLSNSKGNRVLSSASTIYSISDTEGLRMNDVYRYTMEHYTEHISLEQIAAVAHLTVQAFCRYFKKHTRKTYISFLNEIRINEACKKMTGNAAVAISAVAYECGFSSAVSFNRVFKQVTGVSPSRYLADYRQQVN